jgi:YVTN family beta-propeller protein
VKWQYFPVSRYCGRVRASRSCLSGVVAAVLAATSLALTALPGTAEARAEAVFAERTDWSATGATSHSGDMTTIDVGRLPTSVAVDQRTGSVWVVNSLDSTVSEISEARRAVVATIKVPASPVDIAADPKTGTVWVTCLGPFGEPALDNVVAEISEATGKVVATIKVGPEPFGIAADQRTGMVWVANTGGYSVSEISEARETVVATVRTGTDSAPVTVAVDQARGVVWVGKLHHGVVEISEATRSVIAAINVRPGAAANSLNGIAVDSATGVAWVASDRYAGAGYLSYASAVGTASRRVLASVAVPRAKRYPDVADGIAADAATGTVWVAESGANTVTLISGGTDTVSRNLPTGDQPIAVAVDPVTGTVWVVNNYDGTVTEYAYSRPSFTTGALVSLAVGRKVRFPVRTSGFPVAVMTVSGALPPGIRARVGHGRVVLTGIPAPAARGRTYRVTISADNGVGTPSGQYLVSHDLVLRVS